MTSLRDDDAIQDVLTVITRLRQAAKMDPELQGPIRKAIRILMGLAPTPGARHRRRRLAR